MKTINTVFAVHNHQPIGNFEKVFEEAYQVSYKPFLDLLELFPSVKFTQHWTGTLMEWLVRRHPEFVEKMRMIVHRGQIELLTGSYYEAILSIVPERDRIGQIRKLTDTIHRIFDYVPRGMWLAERVWEQSLVRSLTAAGVEFVVVDDTHFKHAGLQDDQLFGYYITEDQGETLHIVPIDKMLRYTVPFRPVEETLHYLQRVASEDGGRVVIHADDGEKFGVWPKTFEHVFEQGWLESFCRMLEQNTSWIRTTHFGSVLDSFPPLGRVYLPTASYAEMMKWALNPTAFLQIELFERQLKEAHLFDENSMFVQGGFWRNFLSKYPEANHMHKKMLRVAKRAHSLADQGRAIDQEVFDHIWAGQCNDPYWHGVFGGLYLPNLRFPVYRNLLQAESKLDALDRLPPVRVEEVDFDCDGFPEVLIESDQMNLYFTPHRGGSLVELDYKPIAFNLLDIVSRREEGYHRRLMAEGFKEHAHVHDGVLTKEPGLDKHLHFDWYRRASLLDHFFDSGTTLESFAQCKYLELGDFVNQPYEWRITRREGNVHPVNGVELTLIRDGALWCEGKSHRLTVCKLIRYDAENSRFSVDYTLVNLEHSAIDVWFGVEWNVGLMAGDAHDRYYRFEGKNPGDTRLRSTGEETDVESFTLVDEWLGIEVGFSARLLATVWRFPIETVSLSEAGFERLYQSSVITFHWKLRLEREFTVQLVQSVKKL